MHLSTGWRISAVAIATSLISLIGVGIAEAGCKSGFVWRDAKDGDGVCVTPAERQEAKLQNANATNNRRPGTENGCRDGYVWREAWVGDTVCVTPHERTKAKNQNAMNAQHSTPDAAHAASAGGYASVAVNGRGAWGASLGLSTPDAAGADAVSRCGGGCRAVMTGRGRCVAFADSSSGGYWYGHAYGNDSESVRRTAMQGCSAGAPRGSCSIKHVNCG
jgi:Domain of unknown function (DUF4189)